MNTLMKSGGAWMVSTSLAAAALRRMRVSGFATSSSSSFPNWEGGVSLVQGASRGIGLEFVSLFLDPSFSFYLPKSVKFPANSVTP